MPTKIRKINLKNNDEITFDPYLNIITGANGIGKSQLLRFIASQIRSNRDYHVVSQSEYDGLNQIYSNSQISRRTEFQNGFIDSFTHSVFIETTEQRRNDNTVIDADARRNFKFNINSRPADTNSAPDAVSVEYDRMVNIFLKYQNLQTYPRGFSEEEKQKIENEHNEVTQTLSLFNSLIDQVKFQRAEASTANSRFVFKSQFTEALFDGNSLSDGEKEILSWLFILTSSKNSGKIIIFDEWESHMHPSLQREFLIEIRKLAKQNEIQLLLSNHSPTVVDAAESYEIIGLNRDNSGLRVVEGRSTKQIFSILGSFPSLIGIYLLVEGDCDEGLSHFFSDIGHLKVKGIGGEVNIKGATESLNSLGLTTYGLRDRDGISQDRRDDLLTKKVYTWDISDIESNLLDLKILNSFVNCVIRDEFEVDDEEIKQIINEKIESLSEVKGWKLNFIIGQLRAKLKDKAELTISEQCQILENAEKDWNSKPLSEKIKGKDVVGGILDEIRENYKDRLKPKYRAGLNIKSWLLHLPECESECGPQILINLKTEVESNFT